MEANPSINANNNSLTLMNVSSSWQAVAKETVIILAVGLDQWRMRA
jgi:predicted ABC-type sugar transport system permease subunit